MMKIIFTKGNQRNKLQCIREDGSSTSADLGPSFPNHDLAHYVVEKKSGFTRGFYGAVKQGKTIQELSDPEVIRTLDAESWLAEIMTRNLQALDAGAGKIEDYEALVKWEVDHLKLDVRLPEISREIIVQMKIELDDLYRQWGQLKDSEKLILKF